MKILLFLLIAFLNGYMLSRFLRQKKNSLAVIFPLGFGTIGFFAFWILLLRDRIDLLVFFAFEVLFLFLSIVLFRKLNIKLIFPVKFDIFDIVIFAFIFFPALTQKFGFWDAWAVWNVKAKFLFFDGGVWTRIFLPLKDWLSPDYPILLPSIIASGWKLINAETFWIPLVVSVIFAWSVVVLVKESVSSLLGKELGILAGLIVFLSPNFVFWGGSQYADIPLAAYLFLGFWLLFKARNKIEFIISGFSFGLAMFVKNEGTLYFLIILASFVLAFYLSGRREEAKNYLFLLIGLVPGIVSLAIVKFLTPSMVYFQGGAGGIFSRLAGHNLFVVSKGFWAIFWGGNLFWPIFILLFIFLIPRKLEFWHIFFLVFLSLSFLAYLFIYLVTPLDIFDHIIHSFDRLLIQILPLFVFALALLAKEFLMKHKINAFKNENSLS